MTRMLNKIRFILSKLKKCSTKSILLCCLGAFLECVFSIFIIVKSQKVFDEFGRSNDYKKIIIGVTVLSLYYIASNSFMIINNYYYGKVENELRQIFLAALADKINTIHVGCFEKISFNNEVSKAKDGIDGMLKIVISMIMLPFFYIPYFTFLTLYFLNIYSSLAIVMVLIFVPTAIGQYLKYSSQKKFVDSTVLLHRQTEEFENCILGLATNKDIRANNWKSFLLNKSYESFTKYSKKYSRKELRISLVDIAFRVITFGGYAAIIVLVIFFKIEGKISIGVCAAVFQSLVYIFNIFDEFFGYQLGEISEGMAGFSLYWNFITKNFSFNETEKIDDHVQKHGKCSFWPEIDKQLFKLENVSFSYDDSDAKVLNNINLEMNKNEVLAIVGDNGAGKTTLSKILLGILRPSSGNIYFNEDGHKSAILQNFQKYKMTLKDNILLSDFTNEDNDRIIQLKEDFGINSNLDDLLSAEFGGKDISGGQWQRLALARGFYSESNLLVLDEPTSAIDPIEENRFISQLKRLFKDKSIVFITHKVASAQIADRVIVMRKGRIVEEGTFAQLIKQKGILFSMMDVQARQLSLANVTLEREGGTH